MSCVFCMISRGEIPSKKVFENDRILAFHDINPMTPVHVLVIPKIHIESADEVNAQNSAVLAEIFETIPAIAKEIGLTNGYRVVTNCGEDGRQSVKHLHFHVLGGEKLSESMS